MNKKIVIMWEITLSCNLSCSFCISGTRREETYGKISFNDAIKIIDNLPLNSHISFIGGECFLFPGFIKILQYLENKGITFEITSNGVLVENHINELNKLTNFTNIYFSIDLYGQNHDTKRNFKGLFKKIILLIPKIKTKVNVNTVILPETKEIEIIQINTLLEKLKINTHRISYYMNFNQNDIKKSVEKIPHIKITTKFEDKIDNKTLKIKTIKIYKMLLYIKQKNNFKLKLDFHPVSILKSGPTKCKSMIDYYRINEYGNLSTCHFINNDFGNLIENKFQKSIENLEYIKIKNDIIKQFPLNICITCGKGT